MEVEIFKYSRGVTILDEVEDAKASALIYGTIDELKSNGFEQLYVKPVVKNNRPKIYEIKICKVRLFYFINPCNSRVNITNIDEHKDTRKTPEEYKKLAVQRAKLMMNDDAHRELV